MTTYTSWPRAAGWRCSSPGRCWTKRCARCSAARWGTGATLAKLADETGVGPYRVRRILDGDAATDEETALLYEWAGTQPGVYVGPETVAVALLARWGFGAKAGPLRTRLVASIKLAYERAGLRLPPFVYQSLDAAEPAKKR